MLFREASTLPEGPDPMSIRRGRIAIAGAVEALEPRRLLAAGVVDCSFGQNGASVTPAQTRRPGGAIRQSDGTLLIASVGGVVDDRDTLYITRYSADGTLDRTFGVDGHKSYRGLVPDVVSIISTHRAP